MEIERQSNLAITSRIDTLPFSKWHIMLVISLGFVWIFDGYQVSLVSLMSKYILKEHSETEYKALASSYQIGALIGSIIFGISSYIIGRRKIFLVNQILSQITLSIYTIGVILSTIKSQYWMFILGRGLTGFRFLQQSFQVYSSQLSVGGQFTAIFSAIDQFLPPAVRGRVNIGIDGTWHLGGILASLLNVIVDETPYWRLFFSLGIFGAFSLACLRRSIPQSPRWLIMKCRQYQAEKIVEKIEYAVQNNLVFLQQTDKLEQINENVALYANLELSQVRQTQQPLCCHYTSQILNILYKMLVSHTKRLLLSWLLIFSQAFFFNVVYYQYPRILSQKYNFEQKQIGFFMMWLSLSSWISTLLLGTFFDTIGRKIMILVTCNKLYYYLDGFSGILLIITMYVSDTIGLQIIMCILFLFSSPAASSANLIASQIFPTQSRTIILSVVLIVGLLGAICGMWINSFLVASILMGAAAIVGFFWCPNAQKKSLQQIAIL